VFVKTMLARCSSSCAGVLVKGLAATTPASSTAAGPGYEDVRPSSAADSWRREVMSSLR
jgi:hypothetical protein